MKPHPPEERSRPKRRDPHEVLELKLHVLRTNPNAQVFFVTSPETGAFSGVLFGLDRGLGLLKAKVPHAIRMDELRVVLQEVESLNTTTERFLNAQGVTVQSDVEDSPYDGTRLWDREQEVRHPKSQVFTPHHDQTRRMVDLIRGINMVVSRARAALSVATQHVSVFEEIYAVLDAYDQQAQRIYATASATGYHTPKFLHMLKSRGLGGQPREDLNGSLAKEGERG